MARPPRNDVDYFPHKVTHGKSMYYLRNKYGNDAYAVWFMFLEHLGRAEYHFLNLSSNIQIMYLSAEMKVNEDLLIDIINTMVELEVFDKELWEKERILFNQKFIDNIADAYKKRNNSCINRNSLITLLHSNGTLKHIKSNHKPNNQQSEVTGNPQSIVKETILKESSLENLELDAYNFLKKQWQSKMEIFEMQNEKSFPDYDNFIMNFNSKVVEEKLDFEPKILWARLQRLNSNWNKEPKTDYPVTEKLTEKLNKHG